MEVEIAPPAWYPFHDDPDEILKREVTSVGVWAIVYENNIPKWFVALEQADRLTKVEGGIFHPWEIPSGRAEEFEDTPRKTGCREFEEEMGIGIEDEKLNYLGVTLSRNTCSVHYYTLVDFQSLGINNPEIMGDGTLIFEPNPKVNRREISRIALIPLELLNSEDNLLKKFTVHPRETSSCIDSFLHLAWMKRKAADFIMQEVLEIRQENQATSSEKPQNK